MRKLTNSLLLFLFTFAQINCSTKTVIIKESAKKSDNLKPTWINQPEESFPKIRFVTAVGTGKTRSLAEDKSRENLSKYFESHVQASSTVRASFKSSSQGKNSDLRLESVSRTSTNTVLAGVKIEKIFEDKDGTFYALAALNKDKGSELLKIKLSNLSQKIAEDLKLLKSSKPDLLSYAKLGSIKKNRLKWQVFYSQYQLITEVDPSPPSAIPSETELSKEKARLDQAGITFEVEMKGGGQAEIGASVRKVLVNYGFNVVANAGSNENGYVFSGKVKMDPSGPRAGWYYVNWLAEFTAIRIADKRIDLSIKLSGKAAQTTEQKAMQKALKLLGQETEDAIKKQIENL